MDTGGDDQKIFAWMQEYGAEFVIAARHHERIVEVCNPRLEWRQLVPASWLRFGAGS